MEKLHKFHKSITPQRVARAVEADDYIGFCRASGHQQENVEGDAHGVTCHNCGRPEVMGAEDLLLEVMP